MIKLSGSNAQTYSIGISYFWTEKKFVKIRVATKTEHKE